MVVSRYVQSRNPVTLLKSSQVRIARWRVGNHRFRTANQQTRMALFYVFDANPDTDRRYSIQASNKLQDLCSFFPRKNPAFALQYAVPPAGFRALSHPIQRPSIQNQRSDYGSFRDAIC